MADDIAEYTDRTYKMLRGLRKSGPEKHGFRVTSCIEVPEKRNRALIPKYGQPVRSHCPQKDEILTKKVTEHEIIWLEFEEEDQDCFERDVTSVTQAADTGIGFNKRCAEYVNYFKRLTSFYLESGQGRYSREVIYNEEELREMEAETFHKLRMLLKAPGTHRYVPTTRAGKNAESVHVINADVCAGKTDIKIDIKESIKKESDLANMKEHSGLRHTENNVNNDITSRVTVEITECAVTDVKHRDNSVRITDECKPLSMYDSTDLKEHSRLAATVAIDICENTTKVDKVALSWNDSRDISKLNSSAVTVDIIGGKTVRKSAEVHMDSLSVDDYKFDGEQSYAVTTEFHETGKSASEVHDDFTVSTDAKRENNFAKTDAEDIREAEITATYADDVTSSDVESAKANKQNIVAIITSANGTEANVKAADISDDISPVYGHAETEEKGGSSVTVPIDDSPPRADYDTYSEYDSPNFKYKGSSAVTVTKHGVSTKATDACDHSFSIVDYTVAKKQCSCSTKTEAAVGIETEPISAVAVAFSITDYCEAKMQGSSVVASDDSGSEEQFAEAEDDIWCVNDTIDNKSNLTGDDIDSLSDLPRETEDDVLIEIGNTTDTINQLDTIKETEETDDDDGGIMCGILWVYAAGQ